MKILVIGSGGREHALIWALKQNSASPLKIYCAPGNAGIAQLGECVNIAADKHFELIEFARANAIDLTIVGPEVPLANGIVDEFQNSGLKIVGPSQAAARLESSKAFAKDFMQRHAIPTADYVVAHSSDEALSAVRSDRFGDTNAAVVVKADGLAAGKGVIVARSRAEAESAIAELLSGSVVAQEAANQILIEEALEGREVSVLLFADGHDYALMPAARDHKRIGENDTGPNTGGMGAITDASIIDPEVLDQIVREVVEPTLKGAVMEGFPFRGVLFIGLMLTAAGPKVLEYNVRFGDPETQAILIRLESDLAEIFQALVAGRLREVDIRWREGSSACVVIASEGYPGAYPTGAPITGLDRVIVGPALQVFHAGTSWSEGGELVTAGGRVLGITAWQPTLDAALARCYEAVDQIDWSGKQFRRDIGRFGQGEKASGFRI
ncbi:MAG: phosphoribosylamine---glycine ligase [Pyrinomonadaceae bacterium]|jgi:phosphoribosylamine--glycine ligase|nr:phosphoribosylamine---glycine ligase [Pyrinomonadaceae bacterium]